MWTEHLIKKKKNYRWVGMGKQMCYVAGQVISDCLKKWGKKILKCVTLFLFLPSCLPFVSNNTAIPWACCIILLCRLWGSPGGLVMCVLAFCSLLLLLFENYWYREWVIISSPQPLLCEKKPVKMNIWQRNCPDLRRKFPGFMISFFCSSINWRLAEEESLLHSYLEARGGMGWGVAGVAA